MHLRLATLALAFSLAQPAAAATMTQVKDFGPNPGSLSMYHYVPDGLAEGAPLVVALHGCTQTHTDYDDEPGWLELAERHGFALLFPRQHERNQDFNCFNWARSEHQKRDAGEPRSLISMVDRMLADHRLDPARVFVAGLSGGASMTAVLLTTYPDRFAGGAIVGGIPFGCAGNDFEALGCMSGDSRSAKRWGDLVRKAAPAGTERWPSVSIWHGRRDDVVTHKMAEELVKQWTDVHGIEAASGRNESGAGYTVTRFDKDGRTLVELWSFERMGHGSPIAPGDGADNCGRKSSYAHNVGLCGGQQMLKSWGIARP